LIGVLWVFGLIVWEWETAIICGFFVGILIFLKEYSGISKIRIFSYKDTYWVDFLDPVNPIKQNFSKTPIQRSKMRIPQKTDNNSWINESWRNHDVTFELLAGRPHTKHEYS
jgi:hypothetical protein